MGVRFRGVVVGARGTSGDFLVVYSKFCVFFFDFLVVYSKLCFFFFF